MRNTLHILLAALLMSVLSSDTSNGKPADGERSRSVAELMKQLDSQDVDQRHAASVALRNLRGSVLPEVLAAIREQKTNGHGELKEITPSSRAALTPRNG